MAWWTKCNLAEVCGRGVKNRLNYKRARIRGAWQKRLGLITRPIADLVHRAAEIVAMKSPRAKNAWRRRNRRGLAALDYMLVMGIVLPLALVVFYFAPRIISLVYEMTCVLVSWPFM